VHLHCAIDSDSHESAEGPPTRLQVQLRALVTLERRAAKAL